MVEELLGGGNKCKKPNSMDLENQDFLTRALNAKVPASVYTAGVT
jgi:hypothetical protein